MKKLLLICTLAVTFTAATSSFNPAQSASDELKKTTAVVSADQADAPEDVKKDTKKANKVATSSCCKGQAPKAECPEKQQKDCPQAKAGCPAAIADCPAKADCKKN